VQEATPRLGREHIKNRRSLDQSLEVGGSVLLHDTTVETSFNKDVKLRYR